ncbi:NifB/NifX family molybdenum-iron cluster-binding protein [Thermococcus sp.]|uniref:NifB/NifX family molybdenum-iron cluster-binding protein n=1 Tax=Thermococcus sp. TaxID=35749 RepID=UPI00261B4177|nr:NifB/NifX family molybdenum-iron cluster-binding protein [Thermococcus sp.]
MKVVVPTSKGGLDDEVHESLVRAETFTVVELEGGKVKDVKVIENPYRSEPHGAGSKVALFVVDLGADVLVTRVDCPKGKLILDSARVKVVKVGRVRVRDVISGL